jgi:hypothetical protein
MEMKYSENVVHGTNLYDEFEPVDFVNEEEGDPIFPYKPPIEPLEILAEQHTDDALVPIIRAVRDTNGELFLIITPSIPIYDETPLTPKYPEQFKQKLIELGVKV